MPPIRVLFIGRGESDPSSRYRAFALFPHLRSRGVEPSHADASGASGAFHALRAARRAHAVIVLRRTFHAVYRRSLRLVSRRLIFDFDDAVFTRPQGPSSGRRRRFAAMLRLCDQAWAGNEYLAQHARAHVGDAVVLPTSLDPSRYHATPRKPADSFDLVWIGSGSTRSYLESGLAAFAAASSAIPNLRLRIVSDFDLPSRGVATVPIAWSPEAEGAALAGAHVGVAPMPDDEWTRGKCGFKVLQYMAAGLPVVTSPVGVNRDLVIPDVTGFHATSKDEWVSSLRTIADDAALRNRMGAEARRRVTAHYSHDAVASRMVELLLAIVRSGTR